MSASVTEADSGASSLPNSMTSSFLQIETTPTSTLQQKLGQSTISPVISTPSSSYSRTEISPDIHDASSSSQVLALNTSSPPPGRDDSKLKLSHNQENNDDLIESSASSTSAPQHIQTLYQSAKLSRSPTGFITTPLKTDKLIAEESTVGDTVTSDSDASSVHSHSSIKTPPTVSTSSSNDLKEKMQSSKQGFASLKPSLPIISSTMLSDTHSSFKTTEPSTLTLNGMAESPMLPQLPALLDSTPLPNFSETHHDDTPTTKADDSSPTIAIPPRLANHTKGDPLLPTPLFNPRTRKPAPLKLTVTGSNLFEPVASPITTISGENALGSVKQIDLLSTASRSSSAPSTPVPPAKSIPEGKERQSGIPSPLRAAYPSFDNCTASELKVTLSEKLIQLSQVQSQNAQLWTLVNKQRTMIFDLQKDLDAAVDQNEKYRSTLAKYQSSSSTPTTTWNPVDLSSLDTVTSKDEKPISSKVQIKAPENKKQETQKLPKQQPNPSLSPHSRSSSLNLEKINAKPIDIDASRRTSLDSRRPSIESKTTLVREGDHEERKLTMPQTIFTKPNLSTTSSNLSIDVAFSPIQPSANMIPDRTTSKNSLIGSSLPSSKSSFDFNNIKSQPSLNSESPTLIERPWPKSPKVANEPKEIVLFVTPEELSSIWLGISTLIGKVKSSQKRREDPVAVFNALDKTSKKELWKVIKDYTSLVILDNVLRPILGQNNFPKLPDRTLFQSHAPSRVDARKAALEDYFFSILRMPKIPTLAAQALCEFLSTDTVDPMDIPDTPSRREGYLTKRGKKIRGWKVRYFVIEGDYMKYYDKPGGELQSSIYLRGAQIGRQTKTETEPNSSEDSLEKEFRHAFLLLEPKKKDQIRHVLCAESDEDRELWINALLEIISQPVALPPPADIPPSSPLKSPKSFPVPVQQFPSSPPLNSTQASKQAGRNVMPSIATTITTGPYNSSQGSQPILSPTGNQRLKSAYSMESTSSANELRPTVSLEEEYDNSTKEVKKQKKKGFFASFRNRGNNANSHGHSVSVSVQSGLERFQATPYSAVEQKSLPSTRAGMVNPNPSRHDVAGLQALGVSLEEAILSQKDFQPPPAYELSPPLSAGSDVFERHQVRRVFGVPLSDAINLSSKNVHHCKVPSIVYRCIELLKVRGAIFEQGIFRLSGSTSSIRALKERFNTEYDVDLVNSETYYDIHAVAGLLKLYLREIPTLILSSYLAPEFRDAVDIPDVKAKVLKLKSLIQELPKEHRDLLCVLCSLLTEIISHSDFNKMNLRNVGIVFAPTLNISASVLINFLTDFDAIFGDSSSPSTENLNEIVGPNSSVTPTATTAHTSAPATVPPASASTPALTSASISASTSGPAYATASIPVVAPTPVVAAASASTSSLSLVPPQPPARSSSRVHSPAPPSGTPSPAPAAVDPHTTATGEDLRTSTKENKD